MSPVSPVFHTVVTVSIGLKNNWKAELPVLSLTLSTYLMEDRLWHARGPVFSSIPLHKSFNNVNNFGSKSKSN